MKKINSISYGGKTIGCGLIFLMLIPLLSFLLQKLFHCMVLFCVIRISIALGLAIECIFAIVLLVEFCQDKKVDRYCQCHRNVKVKLSEGRYECENCGNLSVKEQDHECSVCGVKFGKDEVKTADEIVNS